MDMKQKKNRGFTLVEMAIILSLAAILLGIIVPSISSIWGYETQQAVQSFCDALSETKTEAMSRLVGEVKFFYADGDYYAAYYIDRGEGRSLDAGEQPERIARGRVKITYMDSKGNTHNLKDEPLILTFDRELEGAFRPIQTETMSTEKVSAFVTAEDENYQDLEFADSSVYCTNIVISGGRKTRILELNRAAGTYTVLPG